MYLEGSFVGFSEPLPVLAPDAPTNPVLRRETLAAHFGVYDIRGYLIDVLIGKESYYLEVEGPVFS